ncbi:MAG: tetratricopeptide repeat protein, partial [Xanthomonadales bacterium]|nr:tetratricopeptide repeat protein [Xanthomonadales bacterium]
MKKPLIILFLLSVALVFSACSRQGDDAQETAQATSETAAPAANADESDTAGANDGELPIATDSDEAREHYVQGEYLMDVGRGVQSRASFLAAIEADPGFARAYWGASNVALSFNEFQEMIDAAGEHLPESPPSDRALVEINSSFLTNSPSKGEVVAESLVAEYPNSARAHIVLAGMQSASNKNEAARASFDRALEIDPESAGALMGLSTNYLFGEPKDFGKAEQVIRTFNEAYPAEARGFEILGDIHRAQGDLEGALAAYQRAGEIDPTLELAMHKQGHINSFLGNIDEARASYDAAIDLAPPESKAGYAVYKCFTRIHEGDVSAAIDELVELADNVAAMGTPDDQVKGTQIFALTSAATVALDAGLYDRAAELIARRNEINLAVAEDVGTEDAARLITANNLMWGGLLAAYQGNGEAAEAAAAEISELVANDDNPRKMEPVHWVRGAAALKAGEYETAVTELRQADHANNMYIRYQLAEALAGAGNMDEARPLYQQVADFNFNSVGFALVGDDAREKA